MTDLPQPTPRQRRLGRLARSRHLINLGFWAVFIGTMLLIERTEMDTPTRIVVALVPLLPLAGLIATYVILFRNRVFDEFGRRVLTEAAATVFVVGMPVLLIYAMLRNASIGVPQLDWQAVWVASALLFGFGVMWSLRRHQGAVTLRPAKGGGAAGGES